MAQTGFTPIQLYSSSTATNVPLAANLATGELAINITDGKLFYKDNSAAVQVIGWKTTPTSAGGTGLTSYTAGDTLYYASGTTLTKLAIGTAYQSFQVNAGATAPSWQPSATSTLTTQGDLPYASGANTLARLAKDANATRYLSNTGTTNNPAWAQINLANGVTGTLPVANGGTNLTSFTANGVVYASSTSALTTGSALVFDGAKLGIGTTSPAYPLDVVGASTGAWTLNMRGRASDNLGFMRFSSNDGATNYAAIGVPAANTLEFDTGGVERMRIDSSGNLLIGKTALNAAVGTSIDANTSTGIGVRVVSSSSTNSADGFQMYSTGAAAYRFYVSFNGTISATSPVISTISDARFKENVRDLDAGLSEVMALKPRLYDWKEGKGADTKNARGFIAQEFEEVFPDLIDKWKDPAPEGEEPYKSVRQDLIPVLVKAIQEQQAIIEQLQADIAALKGN